MKVYVVMQTSYQPNYEGGDTYERTSVYGIYSSENLAKKIVGIHSNPSNVWAPTYEIEVMEVDKKE